MSKKTAGARWKIAEAKQSLSDVIRRAADEPQEILNRDRLVAVVVDGPTFQAFEAWRRAQREPIAAAFAELRRLCAEEGYALKTGSRRDRPNPFADALARSRR